MPTFCCRPQVASFYSSLIQPYTKLCHRHTEFGHTEGHTDEIIYVRFRRYVCISFANFFLCKKYITQLNQMATLLCCCKRFLIVHQQISHFSECDITMYSRNSVNGNQAESFQETVGKENWSNQSTYCTDTFYLRLTDYVHCINNTSKSDIGKPYLQVNEVNEVPINSHIWVASSIFKQL